ncbi:TetR family transcriptional regulator [Acinetobacter sp. 51m]|jgi:AcrR family transcriptional regulator|nr:putative HTH-type transcriptional repressor FabR [Acinetobacter lwoffii SH145]ODN53495.1 TetR family transcriptional regulator [Acinetobacter sp. 51m]
MNEPSMKISSDASLLQSKSIDEPIIVRSVGRKATITKEELFQAALNLIGPQKSISSLSLREVAREAGIAPNSFYRHFKDIDELAIELIDRAGIVLRQILHEARLQASRQNSIIRSSVEVFIAQLDADEGNLSLLLREGYTGSKSYKQAVERQLNYFQQELQDDLIRLERLNNKKLFHPDIAAKAITQLVFNMGANVIDMPAEDRKEIAEQTMIMIRMILEGARHLEDSQLR